MVAIFTKNSKAYIVDWLGMSKAQPWYDLAYLLLHLKKKDQKNFIDIYLRKMQQKGYFLNIPRNKVEKLFKSGIIYQQIIRAKSNAHRILLYKNNHHSNEFKAALDGLSNELNFS